MSRLNKIIALFIVVVFAMTTLLFLLINKKKNEELSTRIVQEIENIDKKKLSKNYNMIFGQIREIDEEKMEYVELMNGLIETPKEERKTKKVKISSETKIEVPCEMLDEEFAQQDDDEEDENEQSNSSKVGSGDHEERKCEGGIENLRDGDFVLLKKEKEKIVKITKKM